MLMSTHFISQDSGAALCAQKARVQIKPTNRSSTTVPGDSLGLIRPNMRPRHSMFSSQTSGAAIPHAVSDRESARLNYTLDPVGAAASFRQENSFLPYKELPP